MILTLLAGPSISGVLLTGIIDGKTGLRDFLSRLLRWRVGAHWHAVALLTAPLLFLAVLLPLSLSSPEFLPGIFASGDKASYLLIGLATGLAAGFFEELGWTGFAIPRLRQRYSVLATGLIVGLLWAVWHLLPAFWLGFASGSINGVLPLVSFIFDPFLFLVVFRVLMAWIYDHTGSLLVGMLMHASLTASSRILIPLGIVGASLLTFDLIWAAAMWLVVAVVVASGRQLTREPVSR
jgi:membrane protease YdiL (CAAX protease family)